MKNTANGYEISIYDVYPVYFWLFLIISIFCGFILMVTESLNDYESKQWILGFLVVLFSNVIILLLPFFRGYSVLGRGDVLSHIGYSIDIINTGHFGVAGTYGENCYPIIHILIVSINQFTGLNLGVITETLPIFFIVFYMIFIYILSKEITKNNSKSILITTFASVLLFQHENLMLAPSVQSFLLLPLILFLFYKSYLQQKDPMVYGVLFIFMLLIMPFFHPGEGTLFLIPLFLGISLALIFYNKINTENSEYMKLNTNLLNIMLIIFVTWATWFISFSSFGRQTKKILNWLIYESGTTNVAQYSNLLGKVNLSIDQIFILATKIYGQELIYVLLALLISLIILKKVLRKNHVESEKFTFSILFFIFSGVAIISFFNNVGVEGFRGMRYVIFISTILIGMCLYDFVKKINYKKIGTILIISVLMLSSIISIFNTYPSPIIKDSNSQVTQMELTGTNWFLDNRNNSLYVDSIEPQQIIRFSVAIIGENGYNQEIHLKKSPDHFNYTNTSSYGNSVMHPAYFVDWKLSRIFYPKIYPEYKNLWRFTPENFDYLDNKDTSVNEIYSNGEFWVYYLNPS
jgi:hypothetical protein